ncbi:MAG: ABC transporter permease, partial [Candidatus Marinimicrobia bacterium]|nr:ABC transporter permease [Candidatus Neomarinimicrobiota bacterium]
LVRLWRRPASRFALIVLGLFLLAALYGEGVYRLARWRDYTPAYQRVHLEQRYQPPGRQHPFGTDNLGRDVFQRVIQGARIAFHVALVASLIAVPLGTLLGALGGYYGGRTDACVVWLYTTVAAMPGLLFILAIALVAGKGLPGIYLGLGLTTWVGVCRLVRGEVMRQRAQTYATAARALGLSSPRILFRHILPNAFHVVILTFSLRFPAAIGTEVLISFLGLGVQGEPSWGVMINNARLRLWQGVWWEMAAVTLAISLVVLACNLVGDLLRDELDPQSRTTGCAKSQ